MPTKAVRKQKAVDNNPETVSDTAGPELLLWIGTHEELNALGMLDNSHLSNMAYNEQNMPTATSDNVGAYSTRPHLAATDSEQLRKRKQTSNMTGGHTKVRRSTLNLNGTTTSTAVRTRTGRTSQYTQLGVPSHGSVDGSVATADSSLQAGRNGSDDFDLEHSDIPDTRTQPGALMVEVLEARGIDPPTAVSGGYRAVLTVADSVPITGGRGYYVASHTVANAHSGNVTRWWGLPSTSTASNDASTDHEQQSQSVYSHSNGSQAARGQGSPGKPTVNNDTAVNAARAHVAVHWTPSEATVPGISIALRRRGKDR
jgi:hypothetical protein